MHASRPSSPPSLSVLQEGYDPYRSLTRARAPLTSWHFLRVSEAAGALAVGIPYKRTFPRADKGTPRGNKVRGDVQSALTELESRLVGAER